jgi:hypothetical protein
MVTKWKQEFAPESMRAPAGWDPQVGNIFAPLGRMSLPMTAPVLQGISRRRERRALVIGFSRPVECGGCRENPVPPFFELDTKVVVIHSLEGGLGRSNVGTQICQTGVSAKRRYIAEEVKILSETVH